MKRLSRGLQTGIAAMVVLALAACGGGDGEGATDEPTDDGDVVTAPELRIGTPTEPNSFDPAMAQEGHYLPYYQAVYDTLIKREPDGSLSPMLATAWEYDEGNTRLTLTLRDDVVFSDGAAFDSSAVKANIDHFIATNGPQVSQAIDIAEVETPDPLTAVIVLERPDPSLELSLANALGLMGSPDALGTEAIARDPVGSGPYLLDTAATVVGSEHVYLRNPDYWGDPLPYDRITIALLADETARLNALVSGQLNGAVFSRPSNAAEIEAAGLQVLTATSDWLGFIYFDRTGELSEPFGDLRVREALTIAVDTEAILDTIYAGYGEITDQLFGTATLAYREDLDDSGYAYDPDRARQLLADAGYGDGFEVDMPISPVFDPAVYTAIEQQWSEVGVTLNRVEYGPGEMIPAMLQGNHYIALMSLYQPNDWTAISQMVSPAATWNPLGTEDPTVTGLIEDIRLATDDAERESLLEELNEFLVEQQWFGGFFRPEQIYGVDQQTRVELQAQQAVPSIYNYSPVG